MIQTCGNAQSLFESLQTLFWATFGLIDLENFELTGKDGTEYHTTIVSRPFIHFTRLYLILLFPPLFTFNDSLDLLERRRK